MATTATQPVSEPLGEACLDDSKQAAPEAALVPHKGNVTLCEDANGRFVVVHSMTQERVVLPGRGWELHFDDRGFGCLTSSGDSGELRLLEDELRMQV